MKRSKRKARRNAAASARRRRQTQRRKTIAKYHQMGENQWLQHLGKGTEPVSTAMGEIKAELEKAVTP